jgi:serine/threonine protein kinase
VIYCINPSCKKRQNQEDSTNCSCGTPLLIQEQYRLVKPLRDLDERGNTEVFEVDAGGILKVLKVLQAPQNPKLLEMFEREARILQRLQHSGVPRVEPDGYFTFVLNNGKKLHCLVMEKFEGENLEQWLEKNKPISQAVAVDWLTQLTEILGMLHQNELFHRDIKLSNIMLKPDGKLALIDFGTVREMMTLTYRVKASDSRRYEVTGIVSPGYSPPEQINGKAVPQSDFYALGRCFVHLLTGVHPLDFPEDEQTGKLIWYDSSPRVATWLVQRGGNTPTVYNQNQSELLGGNNQGARTETNAN